MISVFGVLRCAACRRFFHRGSLAALPRWGAYLYLAICPCLVLAETHLTPHAGHKEVHATVGDIYNRLQAVRRLRDDLAQALAFQNSEVGRAVSNYQSALKLRHQVEEMVVGGKSSELLFSAWQLAELRHQKDALLRWLRAEGDIPWRGRGVITHHVAKLTSKIDRLSWLYQDRLRQMAGIGAGGRLLDAYEELVTQQEGYLEQALLKVRAFGIKSLICERISLQREAWEMARQCIRFTPNWISEALDLCKG